MSSYNLNTLASIIDSFKKELNKWQREMPMYHKQVSDIIWTDCSDKRKDDKLVFEDWEGGKKSLEAVVKARLLIGK